MAYRRNTSSGYTNRKIKESFTIVNDEIASANALLNSYNVLCEHKRQEVKNLNNGISKLETIISRFKNNNEEYLKIKKTVEEEVSRFLKDGKVLLQFAVASVIESLRRNSNKHNNLLVSSTSASSISTPPQGSILSHIEAYKDVILDEAKRLHDNLLTHFTNSIIDNAAGASSSDPNLSSIFPRPPNQSNTYSIEEQGSFHNSQDNIAD